MAAHLQRETTQVSFTTSTVQAEESAGCRPKTLPPFPNLSCPSSTQTLLHMLQPVADWVPTGFRHSPPPPHKFFHTPLHLPPLLPSLHVRELGAIIIIIIGQLGTILTSNKVNNRNLLHQKKSFSQLFQIERKTVTTIVFLSN